MVISAGDFGFFSRFFFCVNGRDGLGVLSRGFIQLL